MSVWRNCWRCLRGWPTTPTLFARWCFALGHGLFVDGFDLGADSVEDRERVALVLLDPVKLSA